jgi:hypothetical protein
LAERGIDWIKQYCDFAKKYLNLDLLSIFQSQFWFTIEPEHKGFKQDAEHLGWNRLLYATDQGHDQGDCGGANAGNDISTIAGLNLTNDQQDFIYFRNFEQCFKPVF